MDIDRAEQLLNIFHKSLNLPFAKHIHTMAQKALKQLDDMTAQELGPRPAPSEADLKAAQAVAPEPPKPSGNLNFGGKSNGA